MQDNLSSKFPGTGLPFNLPFPPNMDTTPPRGSFVSASFLDIPYAVQSRAQKLDIYLPVSAKVPYPVIALFHGGGWSMGDKRHGIAELAEPLLARGYAVASVNYRLTDEAIFPTQIYDAKAAIRWIRANGKKYNFDLRRLIAWGASAGAYLAALLGTSGDVEGLEDLSMGNPEQSSRVNAVYDLYGPIDFLQMDPQREQLGYAVLHDTDFAAEEHLMGCPVSKAPEKCRAANPMTYIRPDNPPFYIQHGKADEAVPYLQGVNFASALRAVIGDDKVRLDLMEDAGHLHPVHFSAAQVNRVLDFFGEMLK
ncbi:MAG TPA: alpha/beta hydrolase [Dehalococcoidia bacterium]|nr:alpha/beta hydrolase [Dehalococcoidia bacterium]